MHSDHAPGAPELIARAIIYRNGSLLVNRGVNVKTGEVYYALPGGHVDPGESSRQAVQRELLEELEAEVTVGDLAFVSESVYPGRHHDDGRRHEIVLYFLSELMVALGGTDGCIASPEPDKDFLWLAVAALPNSNLLPKTMKQYLLQGSDGPPRYGYSDDTAS